ncbi:MAG: diacylglycerol kinase family protein [Bacteroidales bacterium]|nr:diacylglycerol kinase family protein [Bacteroidales bacterium]
MTNKPFKIKTRINSFKHAINGLIHLFKNEHNSWIHALAVLVVATAGLFFKLNTFEWVLVTFAIGLVFTAEIINTSIERLVDLASPNHNQLAKEAKDLAAAAVLIAAIVAVIIALFIFVPKIKARINSNNEKLLVYEEKNLSENIQYCCSWDECYALGFGQHKIIS